MFGMSGKIYRRVLAICGLAATLSMTAATQAEDWPEWRGKGRLGVWNDTGILDQFPSGGLDFVWRVPVNEGYGGPAVANGLVFVTDFQRTTGNNGIERLLCLDEKSGRVIWTHEWEIDTKGMMNIYANGPRATPTVDEDRVYVLGQMGNLFCIHVTDGSVIWQRDYVKDFGATVPIWGMVGAPLVDGPRLYCLVGGEPNAKAMALDKMTGEEIWRSISSESEPGYAPPVLVQAGDIRQVIIWHPTGIVSLDPETGKPFWEKPYEVAMGQTIAQPIFDANRLMVSSSSHGSTMLHLSPSAPTAEVVWKGESKDKDKVDGLHAFNATPFIDGDYVYGVGGKGFLRCVEAKTGKEVWSTAEPSEDARIATAFLVKNGDRFFINNDRGELILAELSPEGYRELSRTKLIEPLNKNARVRREMGAVNWSHPAYANGHIFQRNNKELVRASLLKE